MCDLREVILEGLTTAEEGKIAKAAANIEVYLHNPVGIGEHPDVLAAISTELDIIAEAKERVDVINMFRKS